MVVAEQLDLDVARPREAALEVDAGVAEGGARLRARGRGSPPSRSAGIVDDPHALAAAAGDRLDQQRVADRAGRRGDVRRPGRRRRAAARCRARPARRRGWRRRAPRSCCPSARSPSGDGPMNVRPASWQARGEGGVLGEEPVAGVDGVGARRAAPRRRWRRCAGSSRAASLGPMCSAWSASRTCRRGAVAVGIDRDRRNAHLAARPDDPDRDFAAVGDQDFHEAAGHADGRRLRSATHACCLSAALAAESLTAGCCRASSAGSCRAWSRGSRAPR